MTSITSRFCSICLDTKSADKFNVLPCLHWFCGECLGKLLHRPRLHTKCPLCRSPFGDEIEPSSVGGTEDGSILSRSAPSTGESRPAFSSAILSRSAGSSVEDFESILNFTGLQNRDSLSQVLTELEVRERSHHRHRRRRRRRHPPPPPPSSPSTPSPPSSPLFSGIFQFDDDSSSESKAEENLDDTLPELESKKHCRGDRWAHLNRQRGHRQGR